MRKSLNFYCSTRNGLVHVCTEDLENFEYTHIHLNVFYFEF